MVAILKADAASRGKFLEVVIDHRLGNSEAASNLSVFGYMPELRSVLADVRQ